MKRVILSLPAAIIFLSVLVSCKKEINQDQEVLARGPGSVNNRQGFVYVESNVNGTNSILMFSQGSNGKLTFVTSIPSGGNGTGAALSSQGALQLSDDGNWLFAVNAGSNSITSFNINNTGSPTPVATVPSNGSTPVSLAVHGDLLYVVNSASANITGFRIGENGGLTMIPGSNQSLSSPSAAPASISFTPKGNALIVTEKFTSKITTFPVNAGVAEAASSVVSTAATPFGVGYSSEYIILTQAAPGPGEAPTMASFPAGGTYSGGGSGSSNLAAASWPVVTSDGQYVFVSNTLSDNISTYSVGSSGALTLINSAAATTGVGPSAIGLSANESYLYVVNISSHSISQYKRGHGASLQKIGELTGLPVGASGLVAL
jgi:6-phosphogluconolactonase